MLAELSTALLMQYRRKAVRRTFVKSFKTSENYCFWSIQSGSRVDLHTYLNSESFGVPLERESYVQVFLNVVFDLHFGSFENRGSYGKKVDLIVTATKTSLFPMSEPDGDATEPLQYFLQAAERVF